MTVHERDCAPCDAAREVVDRVAERWDPLDHWSEVEATAGPGTLREEFLELTAEVLHRFPLGARTRPGATR